MQNTHTESSNDTQDFENTIAQWLYERVRPFISGKTLEIESEKGSISSVNLTHNLTRDVLPINLDAPSFDIIYADLIGSYDTVIALHITDQIICKRLIASNCEKLLKPGGHFITKLPARTALFKGLDQGFKHWKLYNLNFINKLLRRNFSILKVRYFMISQNATAPKWTSKYSERVTLFNIENPRELKETGLSIIIVGRKRLM